MDLEGQFLCEPMCGWEATKGQRAAQMGVGSMPEAGRRGGHSSWEKHDLLVLQ